MIYTSFCQKRATRLGTIIFYQKYKIEIDLRIDWLIELNLL